MVDRSVDAEGFLYFFLSNYFCKMCAYVCVCVHKKAKSPKRVNSIYVSHVNLFNPIHVCHLSFSLIPYACHLSFSFIPLPPITLFNSVCLRMSYFPEFCVLRHSYLYPHFLRCDQVMSVFTF